MMLNEQDKPKLSRQVKPGHAHVVIIRVDFAINRNLGASSSNTTRDPARKGFKPRFGYDHIAPDGCGDANQEGTVSYVLLGSNTTHV